jgi:hypothetical protein
MLSFRVPKLSAKGTSEELNDLGKALIKQSRLSAFAAGSAAIAALLQGFLAIAAHQISN